MLQAVQPDGHAACISFLSTWVQQLGGSPSHFPISLLAIKTPWTLVKLESQTPFESSPTHCPSRFILGGAQERQSVGDGPEQVEQAGEHLKSQLEVDCPFPLAVSARTLTMSRKHSNCPNTGHRYSFRATRIERGRQN
jgi:hypothetical protein